MEAVNADTPGARVFLHRWNVARISPYPSPNVIP
jgi:hypothetical protein